MGLNILVAYGVAPYLSVAGSPQETNVLNPRIRGANIEWGFVCIDAKDGYCYMHSGFD